MIDYLSIHQSLIGNKACLLTNKDWFGFSTLKNNIHLWDVVDLVYFQDEKKHKSMSFMFPYYVFEYGCDPNNLSRCVLAYVNEGKQFNVLVKSMAKFQSSYPKTLIHFIDIQESWTPFDILTMVSQPQELSDMFYTATILKYQKPLHRLLQGSWIYYPIV